MRPEPPRGNTWLRPHDQPRRHSPLTGGRLPDSPSRTCSSVSEPPAHPASLPPSTPAWTALWSSSCVPLLFVVAVCDCLCTCLPLALASVCCCLFPHRSSAGVCLPEYVVCRSGVLVPDAMEKYRQLSTGGLDEAQVAAVLEGAGAGTVATGKLIKVWHGISISQGVATVLDELVSILRL